MTEIFFHVEGICECVYCVCVEVLYVCVCAGPVKSKRETILAGGTNFARGIAFAGGAHIVGGSRPR